MEKLFTAIGLMSGTSGDGVDASVINSDGKSHYEVLINGKRVNSQTLKLPSGKILKGNERKVFETKKIKLNVLKSEKIIGLN